MEFLPKPLSENSLHILVSLKNPEHAQIVAGFDREIAKMKADVARGAVSPGQLIIYPQGTRVPPGEKRPYKVGTGLLYDQLGQPCVPVATNVGLFWPKRGILRKPGLAVVEFLPVIAPGKPVAEFMALVEAEVETASDRLMAEAAGG